MALLMMVVVVMAVGTVALSSILRTHHSLVYEGGMYEAGVSTTLYAEGLRHRDGVALLPLCVVYEMVCVLLLAGPSLQCTRPPPCVGTIGGMAVQPSHYTALHPRGLAGAHGQHVG